MNATAPAAVSASLQTFPLDLLVEHPDNPRRHFDLEKLQELAASIAANGLLNPLLVRPERKDGKRLQILAGARRYRAAKMAGLAEVPVLLRDLDDAAALELMVTDNQQRQDVHPLEEAQGYHLLHTRAKYDVARIAEKVGLSVKYVYDRMKLLSLTKEAQELFLVNRFTAGHAVILARLKPEDQARAIKEHDALFTDEHPLFAREAPREKDPRKPRSVRELQAWVDQYVRFDDHAMDPVLFPATVETVQVAQEQSEKIVPITHNHYVPPEAKDDSRTYGPMSWRRADGLQKSKTCERSVTGVIVVGPGRGEAFRVCIDKKKCSTHWGAEQRDAKKRAAAATKGGSTGEDRYEIQRRKDEEARKKRDAELARWKKAEPAILEALAAALKKAPVRDAATVVVSACESHQGGSKDAAPYIPAGKGADELLRHAALIVLISDLRGWRALEEFPKVAKAWGIDVKKIVDQAAPPEKPEPKQAAAKPGKKPGRARATA